jgi:prepilin-type N-terminal cleavage/methylation domain-containing protein/prepilin-type processing-associated H-X9-DG protein
MRRPRAFTLVELLVVIGIIAVLIGVLLPVLSRAQKTARKTSCLSNQRQLIMALTMYCQENDGYFPGGPGIVRWRDDLGNPQGPSATEWTARYNPDAYNPYACNDDEQAGPTFLAKYVSKSKQVPACPEEPFLRARGSFWPNNYWTGFWYPMSLVYTPLEIWQGTGPNVPGNPQKPQKLSKVKYPTNKAVIIDRKTYHDKFVVDTDKTTTGVNNTKKQKLYVNVGFADGHVASRGTFEMFDSDVNWTGRFNINNPATHVRGRAGVLWKDFE